MSSIREEAKKITDLAMQRIAEAGDQGVTAVEIRSFVGKNLDASPGTYRNKDTILDFTLDAFEKDGVAIVQQDKVTPSARRYYIKH